MPEVALVLVRARRASETERIVTADRVLDHLDESVVVAVEELECSPGDG